jgi:hypothetical protein
MRKTFRPILSLLKGSLVLLMLPAVAFGWSSPSPDVELRLAYIDPGTGSFVAQAVVAAIAGVAVAGRLYWSKIKSMLGMATVSDDDEDAHADDE